MAGARALWRATGMKDDDFNKPIDRCANSLPSLCRAMCTSRIWATWWLREIAKAGGVARSFNTIAVDDGIAMGHDGMLYSLPVPRYYCRFG